MRAGRQLLIMAVAVALVIILGWFFLIYRPRGNDLADAREQLDLARAEEQSLQATLGQLQEIDADRPALEAELQRLQEAVPGQPELGSFILASHDMASQSGVAFMSMTPAPPSSGTGVNASVISLGIQAEGRFFAVLEFLSRMEDLDRIVVIDSITLTRVSEEEEEEAGAAAAGTPGGTVLNDDGTPQSSGAPVDGAAIPQPPPDPDANLIAASTPVTQPIATAASFENALAGQVDQLTTVQIQIQARAFTTAPAAVPGEEETATTTTTAAPAEEPE